MEAPTPPYAKYFERVLLVCGAACVAFGIEGVGYYTDVAAGDLMLTPAIGIFILALALAVGGSFLSFQLVRALALAVAIVLVFDVANLLFLENLRRVRAAAGLENLKHIYWTIIAPITVAAAALGVAIVVWLRENSV